MNDRINAMVLINYIKHTFEDCFVFSKLSKKDITKESKRILNGLKDKGALSDFNVGQVGTVWENWNIKQKIKWLFYNKTPILKNISKQLLNTIEKHNGLVHSLLDIAQDAPDLINIPEHLISNPKSHVTIDIFIKPIQSIGSINMSFKI